MDGHRDLEALRIKLRDVLASITAFNPPVAHPPIIDASADNSDDGPKHDSIRGLRKLKESVKRDLDILEKVSISFISILKRNNYNGLFLSSSSRTPMPLAPQRCQPTPRILLQFGTKCFTLNIP